MIILKKLKGTVKKSDLEGGVWILESGGKKYQLKDGPPDLYKDGKSVTVKGNVRKDILGIGMVGPIFEVHQME